MCGIVGTIRIGDLGLLEQMTEVMAYRGPDDFGYYQDGEVCLGHRRLSILDLSAAGHQPMLADDGLSALVFNGEIYNFQALRAELAQRGQRFQTGTDTEVILHAYRAWGLACLERFEGMFAFALWDRRENRLLLARDRLGIKPLFYHTTGTGLAFASELKPLLLLPGLQRTVNRRALRSAIRYGGNLEDESMLASIFKLPPAQALLWQNGRTTLQRFWQHPPPTTPPVTLPEGKLVGELRERLQRAVQSHLISDAPLGASLSGGLDSSAIVALMAQSSARPIETFTIGQGEDDPDLRAARLVAQHWRTNHHELQINPGEVAELLPRVVWHLEEPLGQLETIQLYLSYAAAARHVKVLLIGEGADELFGGYARYKLLASGLPLPLALRQDLYRRVYQHSDVPLSSRAGRGLARLLWGDPPLSPLADALPRVPPPFAETPDATNTSANALKTALNYDQRKLLPHLYLKRADALGMAHSLELRVPFLDRSLVELAARLPASLLVRGHTEKYLLRQALAPLLPRAIWQRRKHPLQMRVNAGLVNTLDTLCDQLLKPADVQARGFFEPARVDQLRRTRPGRLATQPEWKFWLWRIWSMLLCELWARLFLDRLPTSAPPSSLTDLL